MQALRIGKTAVGNARLAHLINEQGLEANKTLMFNFTRTAVAQIQERLRSHVGDHAFAIKVTTVDSHAWSIHSEHDSNERLNGSHGQNIESIVKLIRNDPALRRK